jgi:hypothetical protein
LYLPAQKRIFIFHDEQIACGNHGWRNLAVVSILFCERGCMMFKDHIIKMDSDLEALSKDLGSLNEELDAIGKSVERLEESFVRLVGALSR